MKIYTKKGDKGQTSLLFGGKVTKGHLRIECLGDLDELNSFLGLSKTAIKSSVIKILINALQKDIYVICSEVATQSGNLKRLKVRLSPERLAWLESQINKLAAKVKLRKGCFFVPGANYSCALLDVCRAISRRAERRVVSLNRQSKIRNKFIIAYLNRLSSLLFVLARLLEKT